jgi:uncharacterized protein (TIGR03032 family)
VAASEDELGKALDRPIFVVAPPQAGTHWVAHALAGSPEVCAPGVAGQRAIEMEDPATGAKSRERSDRLTAADATETRIRRLRAELGRLVAGAADAREEPKRLIDSSPRNALRVSFLDTVFPGASFVFVYREPRDTLESMAYAWRCGRYVTCPDLPGWSGEPWSLLLIPGWRRLAGKALEEVVVDQWTAAMEIVLDDLEALPSDRWSVAEYRALELRPDEELERLSRFLGIEAPRAEPPSPDGFVEAPATSAFGGRDPLASGPPAALEVAERAYELIAKPLTRRPRLSPDAASPLRSVYSAGARQVLERLGCSVLLTAPAADRLVSIRRDGYRVNTHFHRSARPRAVAHAGRRLAVAGDRCVTAYVDRPEAQTDASADQGTAHFVQDQRWSLEADGIEDLAFAGDRILLAASELGCVELAGDHGLRPVWRPPAAAGQRLTGIAITGERLAYATVDGGCVVDVDSDEIVVSDLSQPCAPRWHDRRLWLLESGRRALCELELATGASRTVAELPGLPTGLALAGGVAVVCLSPARVCFIELATGTQLGFVRFEGQISHVGSPVCLTGYESVRIVGK